MTMQSLSQIIGQAVIDNGFRSALLSDPNRALSQYHIEDNELRDIVSFRVTTIEQFAEQLIAWMNRHEVEGL